MSYLFLKKKQKQKINQLLAYLEAENSDLYSKTKQKLDQTEKKFINTLLQKHTNLLTEFKNFLTKFKNKLMSKVEKTEGKQKLQSIEYLIDNL